MKSATGNENIFLDRYQVPTGIHNGSGLEPYECPHCLDRFQTLGVYQTHVRETHIQESGPQASNTYSDKPNPLPPGDEKIIPKSDTDSDSEWLPRK